MLSVVHMAHRLGVAVRALNLDRRTRQLGAGGDDQKVVRHFTGPLVRPHCVRGERVFGAHGDEVHPLPFQNGAMGSSISSRSVSRPPRVGRNKVESGVLEMTVTRSFGRAFSFILKAMGEATDTCQNHDPAITAPLYPYGYGYIEMMRLGEKNSV